MFGPTGARKGIRFEGGVPQVVTLRDDENPLAAGIAVHDESHETPAYAFALGTLARPLFPIPIGVFRAVEKTSYERLLEAQIEDAVAKHGAGDLHALLHSGDTWKVEA